MPTMALPRSASRQIAKPVPAALDQLEGLVEAVLEAGKVPFVIGGEHSLTAGAIRPFARRHKDLVVLQFDAHADLRDGYLGEHYSHAAAMRRVLDFDHVSMVQVGIRAISSGEVEFLEKNRHRLQIHWGKDQARWNIEEIVKPLRGKPVYITFDIDALDGAVMPATGTPTPGGLQYLHALAILRRACEVGNIVGMDLVELAPIEGLARLRLHGRRAQLQDAELCAQRHRAKDLRPASVARFTASFYPVV